MCYKKQKCVAFTFINLKLVESKWCNFNYLRQSSITAVPMNGVRQPAE